MQEAMDVLRGLAAQEARLEPKVSVAFNAFGESAMNILFVYFIRKDADILATQTAVNLAILEHLSAAGLKFAYPTRTLYTKPA
jgi:MscS family membrane protein